MVRIIGQFDNLDKSKSNNVNIAKLYYQSHFDSLDILFLGNSFCYSGINPSYFDSIHLNTFNLGIATAGVNFYSLICKDYLSSVKQKPKAVFILISPIIFYKNSDDIVDYPIHRYLNNPISHESYIYNYQPELLNSYPKILTKSFVKFFYALFSRGNNHLPLDSLKKSKGFIPSEEKYSRIKENAFNPLYEDYKYDVFVSKKKQILLDLTSFLLKNNIKVVFFELPSNKLDTYFSPTYMKDYNSFLNTLQSKYLLIRNHIVLDEIYYRDTDHLNTNGAKLASLNLINEIIKLDEVMKILKSKK